MARKKDGLALSRRLVNGRLYWLHLGAKILICAPCITSTHLFFHHSRAAYAQDKLIYLLVALWTLVATFMAYCTADELILRWLVTYSMAASLVRIIVVSVFSMVIINLLSSIDTQPVIQLTVWVLISCLMTAIYILQSFVASNLTHKARERTLNLFRISVYAVIPIGLASFISMCFLLRIQLFFLEAAKGTKS